MRWFEDHYSLTPEWSDECYVNHSFSPNALWHLGFIFALNDLAAGAEITMDYRLVIGGGEEMQFKDSITGDSIIGLPWAVCLAAIHCLVGGAVPAVKRRRAPRHRRARRRRSDCRRSD